MCVCVCVCVYVHLFGTIFRFNSISYNNIREQEKNGPNQYSQINAKYSES